MKTLLLATICLWASLSAQPFLSVPIAVSESMEISPHGKEALIPVREMYHHFFNHLLFLVQEADKIEIKGGDGDTVRNYYRKIINLSYRDDKNLKLAAEQFQKIIDSEDARSLRFIKSIQVEISLGKISSSDGGAKIAANAHIFAKARDEAMDAEISLLKQKISTDGLYKINEYIVNEFSKQMTSTPIHLPSTGE
jgi:hypothetical protein